LLVFKLAFRETQAVAEERRKSEAVRRYRPSQERSRRTYETVLQAAARILVREGIQAFSTNRLAEVSGLGVGSIYQYFRNKEAILETLALRHLEDIRDVVRGAAATGLAAGEMLDTLVDATLRAHLREPALHRAISEIPSAPAAYPRIAREKKRFETETDLFLRSAIRRLAGPHSEKKIRSAALLVYAMVEATIHRAVTETRGMHDPDVLVTEVKRAVRLYLQSLGAR
jgi:AcrR family transcriptional regulator